MNAMFFPPFFDSTSRPSCARCLGQCRLEWRTFSAQYQQRPIPFEGNLVKREWFRTYQDLPEPGVGKRFVQSWDVAFTATDQSDWSVCTTWFCDRKDFYLVSVDRMRLEFPDLKRRVIELQRLYDARVVLIEKTGLGLGLVQDLLKDAPPKFPRPIGITPRGEKLARLEAQSARIEAGHVLLPTEAPWLGEFLAEVLAFPNGRHDDQVDSLSQFLEWVWRDASRISTTSVDLPHCYGRVFFDETIRY